MTLPRVSIVIPCYNAVRHLVSCLDNVAAQQYPEKEVIVVDGGSKDGSQDIIRQYAEKYPYIRWVSEKDRGIYDAMNKGIGMATGEWIYFLGADDRLYDDRVLTDVFSRGDAGGYSIIYGDVEFLYSRQVYGGKFDLYRLLFVGNISHQAMFYRKEVFGRVGLYDTDCRIYADRDFNIRCFFDRGVRKKYLRRIIAVYNEEDGTSATAKQDETFRDKQIQYIRKFKKHPIRAMIIKIRSVRARLNNILQKPN